MIKHIVRVDDDFFNHLNQIIDAVNNFTPEKTDDSDLKKTIAEMQAEIDRLKKKLAKQTRRPAFFRAKKNFEKISKMEKPVSLLVSNDLEPS